jgi:hypothetical protein
VHYSSGDQAYRHAGFLARRDGVILTVTHQAEEPTDPTIRFREGDYQAARFLGRYEIEEHTFVTAIKFIEARQFPEPLLLLPPDREEEVSPGRELIILTHYSGLIDDAARKLFKDGGTATRMLYNEATMREVTTIRDASNARRFVMEYEPNRLSVGSPAVGEDGYVAGILYAIAYTESLDRTQRVAGSLFLSASALRNWLSELP